MKKGIYFVLLSLLLGLTATAVSAETPAPGGPFNTAFRVQNLDSSASATCSVNFYDASGTVAAGSFSNSTPIAPGDSLFVFTPQVSGLAAAQYSSVVSCNVEVAAVVNFSDADSGASHNGTSSADLSTTWYAPSIYNNFFDFYTNVIVQNASSGDNDITLEIYAPGSTTPVSTETIPNVPANASVAFDQLGNTNLSTDVAYSAIIRGTGNIAAIVNIYGVGGSAENQLYSYNPFSSGAQQMFVPVIMNNYFGFNTAITVQNIGSGPTTVTVTYGTGGTDTATDLAAGSSVVFLNFLSGAAIEEGTITGATIDSDRENIVVTVNESNAANFAASYSGNATGSTAVNAPIVMKDYFTFESSVTCQNVSSTPATATITYDTGATDVSPTLNQGDSHAFLQEFDPNLASGYIGSAVITSSSEIVCVINQSPKAGTPLPAGSDQLYAYDGINN